MNKLCNFVVIGLFLVLSTSNSYAGQNAKRTLKAALAATLFAAGGEALPIAAAENGSLIARSSVNSCPVGQSQIPVACTNCDFEAGDLSGGWVTNGNAGVTTNLYGIPAVSGQHYGYALAAGPGQFQTLSRTWQNVPAGATINGFAGFYDADYPPFSDPGQLVVQIALKQGTQTSIVKSWSAANPGVGVFDGWAPFEVTTSVTGDVTLEIQVANALDGALSSAVVLDDIQLCAMTCNKANQPVKWTLCQNVANNPHNICIDWPGVTGHLNNTSESGDFLGQCPAPSTTTATPTP